MAGIKLRICFTLFVLGVFRSNAQDVVTDRRVHNKVDAGNFLIGRGWLADNREASEIIDLEDLLKKFQNYTGLPITGEFDSATMEKMNSPHCGNADFVEGGFSLSLTTTGYTHLGTSWSQNEITWYLENDTPDLNRATVRSEITRAFQIWADVTPLAFTEVFTSNADIIVLFTIREHGDGNSFDGTGSTLAHAFQPGVGLGGDLHFDDDEQFTASIGINLFQVAVHEIGHSLGLGHSSDTDAIMAPFYNYRSNFALGTDDVNGIQALYGPPVVNPPTRPPMTTQPTTTRTPPPTTPPRTLAPIFCNAGFDATSESFDNAIYLFQGDQVFKSGINLQPQPGYPRPISQELPGAPDFIDAAFLWAVDEQNKYLYLFKGSLYWRFHNGVASSGYPLPITNWGLSVDNIDAVFRWPLNGGIYFFKDSQFYRFNSVTYRIDNGYPRPLSIWNNVQGPISAVLDVGLSSYFFSGQYFQFFNNTAFRATVPVLSGPIWLECRDEELPKTTDIPTTTGESGVDNDGSVVIPSIIVVVVTSLMALWHYWF